jgi:deoxyribodipyrimidine photo-lyase
MDETVVMWFRRDLRLHDHPALYQALRSAPTVVPVFCFDPALLSGRHRSAPRTQFLLESVRELDHGLRERGSRLIIRIGRPHEELAAVARSVDAGAVFMTDDAGPFARRRDALVDRAVGEIGVRLVAHPGMFVVDDPAAVRTGRGDPYTVFTPYHRTWLRAPRREVHGAPSSLPAIPNTAKSSELPSLRSLGLDREPSVSEPMPGGEAAARAAMKRFSAERYERERDLVGASGTSKLSPYLHFGCVSPRELEHRLGDTDGDEAFRRQLCWRDFYGQVLWHFPGNTRSEHQPRYRSAIRWSRAEKRFDAWRAGLTGYPLVDAAMRQLGREGWMHNRARLVVGSFLTKDLGIDWRWGERWFMRLLLDGDEANNNGNWQWIASVGVDPQPPYRRIYNPARQQARFDPDGSYVRRYVPELAGVPDEYLAEPWTMPVELQHSYGCVIGEDYPEPIVDHAQARREALERYAVGR